MIGRRDVLRFSSAILVAAALEVQHSARAKSAARGARIVVIGGGFGGSSCALQLRALDPTLSVTVVDPDDLYVTCPMSNGVLAGLRTLQSLTISRQGIKRRGVTYLRDRAVRIETEKHQVMLASGKQLEYDKVVVAPGIRMLFGTPEGYDEAAAHVMPHAWIAGPQTQLLADRLHRMRDGGVVAISVPAGPMRCPPGPFERATLIAAYLKRTKPRSKVLIYDSNNHFPRQDAFSAAWERLYPGMIQWIPVVDGGTVLRVDPREMELYTSNGKQSADVINIIPPQAPALLAVESGLAQPRGWCPVDPQTFESQNAKDVHVIGDACIADPMPKAASAAVSQATQCAMSIVASLRGKPPAPGLLQSVCYSLLAQGRALSIHGHYLATATGLQQLAESAATGTRPSEEQEATEVSAWYEGIRRQAFAA